MSRRNSAVRRDFPTPAAPRTVKRLHEWPSITFAKASRSMRSWFARPTIGVSILGGDPSASLPRRTQPVRRHWQAFALELERCQRFRDDCIPYEPPRFRTDDNLTWSGSLLE